MNTWGRLKNIFTGRRFWRTFLIALVTIGLLIAGLFGRDLDKLFNRPGASKADITAMWAMAGSNAQNTHLGTFNGPSTLQVKWGETGSNNLIWDLTSGPVIGADGTIYVGEGQELWALNVDGTTKWKFSVRTGLPSGVGDHSQYWINTAPAIASDGTLYLGARSRYIVGDSASSLDYAGNGRLLAVTDGGTSATVKWAVDNINSVTSNLIVGSDDTVYFGDQGEWQSKGDSDAVDIYKDAKVRAFDDTGTEKWNYSVGDRNTGIRGVAMSNDGATIYALDSGHQTGLAVVSEAKLYALSSNAGGLSWTFDHARGLGAPPVVASNNNIYVGCAPDGASDIITPTQVCALNSSGVEQWRYGDGTEATFRLSTYAGLSVGPDDTLYVGSSATAGDTTSCANGQCKLHAISPTGTQRWTFTLPNYFASAPAIGHDGTIYIGSSPTYFAVSPAGSEVWHYTASTSNNFGQFSPAIASDGTLYITSWRRIIALAGSGGGGNIATPGITVTPTTGTTSEDVTSFSFTVVLDTAPTADVTIGIVSSDNIMHEGVVDKTSLTFTSANWNTPQTVTATGVDDTEVDGDQTYTIATTPANSADANYNNIDPSDVTVTNTDNDGNTNPTPTLESVAITPTSATLSPAGTQTFTGVATMSDGTPSMTVPLTWSATGGTLDRTDGLQVVYTAGAMTGPFEITVSATLNGMTKTANATINITEPEQPTLPVEPTPPAEPTPPTIIQPPVESSPLPSSGPASDWLAIVSGLALFASVAVYRRKFAA